MNTSRRTFIKNSLSLAAAGIALPSLLSASSAIAAGTENDNMTTSHNLLNKSAIFSGSSFYGKVNYSKLAIDTDNYYPQTIDGNIETGWTPMEEKGPHWLEMRWRYPVRIDGFVWKGENLDSCHLETMQDGKFVSVAAFRGSSGKAGFPEITTDRIRFVIDEFSSKPFVSELSVIGPEQPAAPTIFPEDYLEDVKFQISHAKVNKSTFQPLETIQVSFDISTEKAIAQDCYFIIEMREKAPGSYFRHYFGGFVIGGIAASPDIPTSQWKHGERHTINATIPLPHYAPSGETYLSVLAITMDGSYFVHLENPEYGDNRLIPITIQRPPSTVKAQEYPDVKLADVNGQRVFQVGSEVKSELKMPFFNRFIGTCDFERFHDIKANGIDIQYFWMYSSCIRKREEQQEFLDWLDQQITSMLRVRPECYFMIGMDLRVTREWVKDNPDEIMRNYKGEIIEQENRPDRLVSLGSKKYLQECYDFIDLVIDFINSKPYGGRIIGYYPYACTKQDAFIGGIYGNSGVSDRDKVFIGDFHPNVTQQFREWLKKKYTTNTNLQKAWKDNTVTFETALPDAKSLVAEDAENSVFRDPAKSRAAIDYITFFPTLIGGFYQKIAAHYKKRSNRKALVFMNYGAVLATLSMLQPSGARGHVNNNDFYNLLQDENIDMFVQSMPYNERSADDPIDVYQPIESINIHKKMYMFDYDARTLSSGTLRYGRHRSQYESEAILKRDFSWILLKNGGAWLSEMSTCDWRKWQEARNAWFSTAETTTPTKQTLELFHNATTIPKKPVAEIAVILDIETPAYEDVLNAGVIYRGLSTDFVRKELNKLGAPYDVILKPDLQQGKARDDYKLYIFVNPFYLSENDRATIDSLKRDGKTLLWFYAPGYVGDDGLDVSGISQITGIDISIKPNVKEVLQMTVASSDNPLTAHLENTHFKTDIWANLRDIHPDEIQPVFHVTDSETTTLAHYADGKAAWAVRDFGDWRSIYSAVPYLNVQAVRNICKYAGVHLYVDEDIVMGADNRFLMFTNGYKEKRTIMVKLLETKTVKDAFTDEIISEGKQSFNLDLGTPETRILRIVA